MIKNNTKKALLLIIWMIVLTSCSDNFCDIGNRALENQCKNINELYNFKFSEAYSFEWDNLYIIDSWISPKEIKESTGLDCDCEMVLDGKRIILFSKNNIVVKKYITTCTDYDFVNMKKQGIVKISKDDILKVEHKTINDNSFYNFYKK